MTVSGSFDGGQFFDIVSCSYGTWRDWCQQAQGMKPTKARFGGANSAILATLPDIVGCTVNRHPSQSLWSTRYLGHPCKCASWNLVKTPRQALVHCLCHVIKLSLSSHPENSSSWAKQLDFLMISNRSKLT